MGECISSFEAPAPELVCPGCLRSFYFLGQRQVLVSLGGCRQLVNEGKYKRGVPSGVLRIRKILSLPQCFRRATCVRCAKSGSRWHRDGCDTG
jgi:hypothetical protein